MAASKEPEKLVTEKNIYQRIRDIMADVSYIQKEDKKVNNQYTFVSHDAVVSKVREFLIKHGVVVIPSVYASEQEGNTTKITYLVDFINIDNPSEKFQVFSLGYGVDPQDKGPGKAMSYAYKYALLKVFALETGDDPERDSIPRSDAAPAKSAPTKGQADEGVKLMLGLLEKKAHAAGIDEEMVSKIVSKYTAMAGNMGFAQWNAAVEQAMAKMKE
jgi:hypothetical protein